jgi:hypothetical protein
MNHEKLLNIFYHNAAAATTIDEYIQSVPRLHELLQVELTTQIHPWVSNAMSIDENRIQLLPEWL